MLNNHLHIWDAVWHDEYLKVKEMEKKSLESISGSKPIIVDNKKRGNK